MPLNESSATALVRFTGLGIVCFNEERRRGEVAVIRDNKHALSVKLQRPVFHEGGGSDVITYQDVAAYCELPKEGVTIEISAAGAGAVEGYEIYRVGGGDFDRLDSPDPHDFRWVVHMDSLHGDARLRPTGERRHPLTKLYVAGGLFYTHRLDTSLFFEKLEKDSAGRVLGREVFGNVGETVGVRLGGEEVNFKISFGGREESHTLKRVEGLPFRIEIKNRITARTPAIATWPPRAPINPPAHRAAAQGGSVNQKEFCHPIATDLDSIDNL